MPLTSKVLSKIVHNRLTGTLDKHIRQEQASFRPERSCLDHTFTLRQILGQSRERNMPMNAHVDLEKAFDSVHRESLWRILRHYGVPQKLVNMVNGDVVQ